MAFLDSGPVTDGVSAPHDGLRPSGQGAPLVDLEATQEKALEFVSLELLQKYALKRP